MHHRGRAARQGRVSATKINKGFSPGGRIFVHLKIFSATSKAALVQGLAYLGYTCTGERSARAASTVSQSASPAQPYSTGRISAGRYLRRSSATFNVPER